MPSPSQLFVYLALLTSTVIAQSQNSRATEKDLQQANAAFHAGYSAASNGDLITARQQFQRVVQLAPQVEEGHSALGAVLYKLGSYADAIKELETAVKMKPEDRSAQENLASAYVHTAAYQKALPIFEHLDTQSSQPLSSDLLVSYSRALAETDRLPAAIRKTRSAIAA